MATSNMTKQNMVPSNGTNQKQSMLDRFKIGRSNNIPSKPGLGKRTSSSSGFSSARSDRSESIISLSSDTNFPSPSALRRIQEAHESIPASEQTRRSTGIRNKFTKEKSSSPKRSPRLGRSTGVTEIKDYGPIDDGRIPSKPEMVYPPHAYSRKVYTLCKKINIFTSYKLMLFRL